MLIEDISYGTQKEWKNVGLNILRVKKTLYIYDQLSCSSYPPH